MKRTAAITLLLMGTACVPEIDKNQQHGTTCTLNADSDVDCIPPDGGHSAGTISAYHAGSGNNAFLWYWLGTMNSNTKYVSPPAASKFSSSSPPTAAIVAPKTAPSTITTSSRGGFGSAAVGSVGS